MYLNDNQPDSPACAGPANAALQHFNNYTLLRSAPCQTLRTSPHWGSCGEKPEAKKGDKADNNFPTDWIDPKPVHWLRMPKGMRFTFYLALNGADAKSNAVMVEHLQNALLYLGAGAKTAVGYGRFEITKN